MELVQVIQLLPKLLCGCEPLVKRNTALAQNICVLSGCNELHMQLVRVQCVRMEAAPWRC